MLQYVRDGREHTLSAIEKERLRERARLDTNRPDEKKNSNESYFPSFLQQETPLNEENMYVCYLH